MGFNHSTQRFDVFYKVSNRVWSICVLAKVPGGQIKKLTKHITVSKTLDTTQQMFHNR